VHLSIVLLLAVSSLVLAATPARAQERNFALTMGYPGSVGVLWRPTKRFALRPAVTFRAANSDDDDDTSSSENGSISTTISGLIYVGASTPLRLYISPRYSYSRTSITSTVTIEVPSFPVVGFPGSTLITSTRTIRGRRHGVAGLFGVEYYLGDRFSVFGETGIDWERSTMTGSSSPLVSLRSREWSVSSTAGVGASLYF
jgi:hypothetical protein